MAFKIGDFEEDEREGTVDIKNPYFMKLLDKDPELKALWNDMSGSNPSTSQSAPKKDPDSK